MLAPTGLSLILHIRWLGCRLKKTEAKVRLSHTQPQYRANKSFYRNKLLYLSYCKCSSWLQRQTWQAELAAVAFSGFVNDLNKRKKKHPLIIFTFLGATDYPNTIHFINWVLCRSITGTISQNFVRADEQTLARQQWFVFRWCEMALQGGTPLISFTKASQCCHGRPERNSWSLVKSEKLSPRLLSGLSELEPGNCKSLRENKLETGLAESRGQES